MIVVVLLSSSLGSTTSISGDSITVILHETSSSSDSKILVNWTSYENPIPSPLVNDTVILGNRISLNITSNDPVVPELEISNITVQLNETGNLHNITSLTDSMTLLLPWLNHNYTAHILISAKTINGTIIGLSFQNITIHNTFAPIISEVLMIGEGVVKNITWVVSDFNIDDTLSFDVLLSTDGGTTFQLIASNLSDTTYLWDSTGFAYTDYIALVRAKDSVGLQDDLESDVWTHTYIPGPITITFQGTSPIQILEGTNDTRLHWTLYNADSGSYEIMRDGVIVEEGSYLGTDIYYRLEFLELGIYNFTLRVYTSLSMKESSPVQVIVIRDYTPIFLSVAIGMIVGLVILSVAKYKFQ